MRWWSWILGATLLAAGFAVAGLLIWSATEASRGAQTHARFRISVHMPGAPMDVVEADGCQPLSEALGAARQVEHVLRVATPGACELEVLANRDVEALELRAVVDTATLPGYATALIQKQGARVVGYIVAHPTLAGAAQVDEQIREEVERLEGVLRVTQCGAPTNEWVVQLEAAGLSRYELSPDAVLSAIESAELGDSMELEALSNVALGSIRLTNIAQIRASLVPDGCEARSGGNPAIMGRVEVTSPETHQSVVGAVERLRSQLPPEATVLLVDPNDEFAVTVPPSLSNDLLWDAFGAAREEAPGVPISMRISAGQPDALATDLLSESAGRTVRITVDPDVTEIPQGYLLDNHSGFGLASGPTTMALTVYLLGPDRSFLQHDAHEVETSLRALAQVEMVTHGLRSTSEINIMLAPDARSRFGITEEDLARSVRLITTGIAVGDYQSPVISVRIGEGIGETTSALAASSIFIDGHGAVPLIEVAQVLERLNEAPRFTVDGTPAIPMVLAFTGDRDQLIEAIEQVELTPGAALEIAPAP